MKQEDKQLLSDIDVLIKKFEDPTYPSDLDDLNDTKSEAERVVFLKALMENEWLSGVLNTIRNDKHEIEQLLLEADSSKLSAVQRDSLVRMRKFYDRFLFTLSGSEEDFKVLRKYVDEQMNHISAVEAENKKRGVI